MTGFESKRQMAKAKLDDDDAQGYTGYYCVVCGKFLPADEHGGVIVHDDVPHPADMDFEDEEKPQ